MEYDFRKIEKAWQRYWGQNKTYAALNNTVKPKCYILDMFPYPSGAGLHVGHPLGYIASDIYARYKRLKGFNVLHPMGYDSFGLPAEQYAIQTGQHPVLTTEQNIARYREQLDNIGFSYDWDREVRTSNADYYKWTQWIFIQLFHSWYNNKSNKAEPIATLVQQFETAGNAIINAVCDEDTPSFTAAEWKGMAEKQQQQILLKYRLTYLSESMVNWCPALGTVLANDEVKDGLSERGGHPVTRKLMMQWSMRITAYADRLLKDLDNIDWPESVKEAQRNWIGKSEGCSLEFRIQNSEFKIEVFTTRPDTIFGVSFLTLAPEHELVAQLITPEQKVPVEAYIEMAKNRSERERMADVKRISGEFTGAHAIHPFTGAPIPIWIGDYVLAGYGTGAVMAVPAHDARDFAFATHFSLPINQVIQPPTGYFLSFGDGRSGASYDAKEGKLVNSDFLNGLDVKIAIKRAIEEIEKHKLGKGKVNFRLRDAIFGRQRYWGEPIPVYYKEGIPYTLPESELPLVLPEVDKYLPTEDGEPPLARAAKWDYQGMALETTTMPGWAGSSWYFLRYMDAKNPSEFASKEAINYWQDVDLYIGGAEHATGHLLYVRFWTKFLYDLGYIPKAEPAKKLINQGMIQGVSAFTYQLAGTNIFISYNIFKKFISDESSDGLGRREYLGNIIKTQLGELAHEKFDQISASIIINHVDVNIVDNGRLDIGVFKDWRKEYHDAVFILEDKDGNPVAEGIAGQYICGSEVEKMSKSKWNVVNPDVLIAGYGADTLRMYEMFLGPLEQSKPWNTNGITGVHNFLRKFWRLFHNENNEFSISEETPSKVEWKALHKTIKKVAEDVERFSFNTSVSTFMICCNELTDLKCNKRAILAPLVIILAPYAPHIAEMLWAKLNLGGDFDIENIPACYQTVNYAAFPEFKEEYLLEDTFEYPVSFNGKTKCKVNLSLKLTAAEVEQHILQHADVQKVLNGAEPKKVIVVPGRIVNMVI